ncbi:MAG: DUF222 domain-containing protein, partial [Pseudonocardia sp.]|nr:DUF222 domain-containing protein [Pseudonocardia sp.]
MQTDGGLGDLGGLGELAPGAGLAAVLGTLVFDAVPAESSVDVLQACYRQLAHDQALVFASLRRVSQCTPSDDCGVIEGFARAAGEIAAALTWTPSVADRELDHATSLIDTLPQVYTALLAGRIDRAKAVVFIELLSCAQLEPEQLDALCAEFVPKAPGLTTRQLAARLQRAILAIDPEFARRRYREATRRRGVTYWLNTDGTVTVAGHGLDPGEATAACARLDRLAVAARRAGHPGGRQQISADLYLGMLDGRFAGLTEDQIITELLAHSRPDGDDPPPPPGPDPEPDPQPPPPPDAEPEPEPEPQPAPEPSPPPDAESEVEPEPEAESEPVPHVGSSPLARPRPGP